jgi:3-deoxy-D-manno-octulosonate 8-phosphate phosphatase (KDO 8-P phosphatase)
MLNFKEKLPHIRLMVFDIDGVLTDGSVICYENGSQVRTMNIKDGFALQYAVKKGFIIAIISGGYSEGAKQRLEKLGISRIFMSVEEKLPILQQLTIEMGINPEQVLYMGDDLPDFPCMKWAGIPVCPADAAHEIRSISDYITTAAGGKGAAREVIEQVMRAQHKWAGEDAYLW